MKKKILVIGGTSLLGYKLLSNTNDFELYASYNKNLINLKNVETLKIDITNKKNCEKILNLKPDIIINTAAITNVDWCEHNIKKTMEVNSLAVRKIANLCNRLSILFIHISTDYVYYGNSSYSYNEKSKAIPKNIYGLSKLKADNYILKYSKKYYIIRSGWIFSRNSKNFIKFIDDSLASNDIASRSGR